MHLDDVRGCVVSYPSCCVGLSDPLTYCRRSADDQSLCQSFIDDVTTRLPVMCRSTVAQRPHTQLHGAQQVLYRAVMPNMSHCHIKLIDRLHATRWTPPDYRQTIPLLTNGQFQWTGNGHSQLPLAELGKLSPNIDLLCTSQVQTGERKQTHTVWPWPLTYDLHLQTQASQCQGRTSCQKSRSKVKRFKQESAHRQTETRTHTDAAKRIISPATRSIITRSTRFARQGGIIKPNPNPKTLTLTKEINKHLRTRLRDRARAMARMRVIWHCELFDTIPAFLRQSLVF